MRASIVSALRAGPVVGDTVSLRAAFVCRDCLGCATARTPIVQRREYASKEPLTDRLRKRIWGGEAPGPKDVYGESNFFPTKEQKAERERREWPGLESNQQGHEESRLEAEAKAQDSEDLTDTDLADAGVAPLEAYTTEQAREADVTYTPAETWDGLKAVGGSSGWWEPAWDKENKLLTFRAPQNPQDLKKAELFNLIRQAYVEAHVILSRDISASSIGRLPTQPYLPLHESEVSVVDGKSSLGAISPDWSSEVVELVNAPEVQSKSRTRDNKAIEIAEKGDKQALQSAQQVWSSLSLESLPLRFAVIKRVIQLTGARISDSSISEMRTLGHLIRELEHRAPPKSTATNLNQSSNLATLPNVHIYATRQTWVDKEKHLGRYKTIVNALKRRKLRVPHQRRRIVQ